MMIELRLDNLEKRIERLEHGTTLDPHGKTLRENISVWFRSHAVLVATQFQYELKAAGITYNDHAVRNALALAWKDGRLERLERGVYIEAMATNGDISRLDSHSKSNNRSTKTTAAEVHNGNNKSDT